MKFSQLIMLIIVINLLNVFVGFSLSGIPISDLEDTVVGWFQTDPNSLDSRITRFSDNVVSSNNWMPEFVGDLLQGLTSALNLVLISMEIILFVLSGWIRPFTDVISVDLSGGIGFMRIIGYVSIMFLWWFNIMLVVKLWKFIKGSDQ